MPVIEIFLIKNEKIDLDHSCFAIGQIISYTKPIRLFKAVYISKVHF